MLRTFDSTAKRNRAISLREQLIWDLRQAGYCFREIGDLLGISRQRASQVERRLIRRTIGSDWQRLSLGDNRQRAIENKRQKHVRIVTSVEFNRRLEAINRDFELKLAQILSLRYSHREFHLRSKKRLSTLFWTVWPLIELYRGEAFNVSRLRKDFPRLNKQEHLSQLLSRLREKGLLRRVGSARIEGHNTEVLMAQEPIERYSAEQIEKVIVRWSRTLENLQRTCKLSPPVHTIEWVRRRLVGILLEQETSTPDIERALLANEKRTVTR